MGNILLHDEVVAKAIEVSTHLLSLTGEAKVQAETEELARLQAMDRSKMSERARLWHETAIRDVYWRRRMATRTPDEVARGVVAPG